MNNWNIIYNNAPEVIKHFMKSIAPEKISRVGLEEAAQIIKREYALSKIANNTENCINLTESENRLKFDLFKNRDNKHINQSEEDVFKILKNLDQTLQPLITYGAVTLPRRNILLDSRNRNLAVSEYSWDLVHFSNTQQGQCNTIDTINQIIEISCNPFRIPIYNNAAFYQKIRVGIREYAAQGIEIVRHDQNTNRNYYHFDCEATVVGNYLDVRPVNVWRPGKVLAQCDRITLDFFGNTEKLQLATDRMSCSFAAGNPTIVTTVAAHGLQTGDLVYFYDGTLKTEYGWTVAVTGINTFVIAANTAMPGTTNVYFATRRIQIQLNFICLENS